MTGPPSTYEWSTEQLPTGHKAQLTPGALYSAIGCPVCNQVGYRGRVAIQECFICDTGMRALVAKRATYEDLREYGEQHGFTTLQYDGMKKVLQGLTTVE